MRCTPEFVSRARVVSRPVRTRASRERRSLARRYNGAIAADDVVTIINTINAKQSRKLDTPFDNSPYYYDVDGDEFVTASDVNR